MNMLGVIKPGRFAFPLACVAAVAMLFVSEGSYWQSVDTLDRLGVIETRRSSMADLQRGILDAESAQRGYLLTGRGEHLQPYDRALQDIAASFKVLDAYYDAQPQAMALLAQLHRLSDARLSELAQAIRQRPSVRGEATPELVADDLGRQNMAAMRALGTQLLDQEARRVAASRHDLYQTLMLSRTGMAALTAIGLLALFMYLRQNALLQRQQQEQRRGVQVEQDRLETLVRQRTAQLTELTLHLQTAREDERHRLARNLHDDLGALLTSAKLDAARIKSRLSDRAPQALELLAHLVGTLNSSIALGRRIIEDLRPSALSNLGLVATLEILMSDFTEHSGVSVQCALQSVELTPAAELMVYRLVQEAVTNLTKYAQADHVWLELGQRDGQVEVSVRDDGVGFDTALPPKSAYGLLGMRFRVEAQGGTLSVVSAPGQGTLVRATLPVAGSVTPTVA